MSPKRRLLAWALTGALLLYVGSYIMLSSRGCYVPGAWGLGFVKWYDWAPQGFANGPAGMKRNRLLEIFYLPIWIIDMRFVHTSEKADSGQHPINTILDQELQVATSNWNRRVRMEWKQQNPQGGANGGQPSRSDTNRASAVAAPHRSP